MESGGGPEHRYPEYHVLWLWWAEVFSCRGDDVMRSGSITSFVYYGLYVMPLSHDVRCPQWISYYVAMA